MSQHEPGSADFLEVANEVRITKPESAHYGHTGEVSLIDRDDEEVPYQVTFNRDLGDADWFSRDELELVE